jgi:hypothetical protein
MIYTAPRLLPFVKRQNHGDSLAVQWVWSIWHATGDTASDIYYMDNGCYAMLCESQTAVLRTVLLLCQTAKTHVGTLEQFPGNVTSACRLIAAC